ncbi:hypothetical protein WJX74_010580 [Apatococcus lobatus]|uniref:Uncharacterized protein n=1 Tax=Apatococcus lobatus TaxID=904363 RepID=A0AAW1RM17_9CHLO
MSKSDSDDEAQHEDQMTSSAALNTNAAVQAAFAGDLSAIETLYGQDLLSGRLPEVLSSANVQLCAAAAKNGHLHILKWALQHRLPRDESIFRAAFHASEDEYNYSLRHRRGPQLDFHAPRFSSSTNAAGVQGHLVQLK